MYVSNLRFTRADVLYVGRGNLRFVCRRIPSQTVYTDGLIRHNSTVKSHRPVMAVAALDETRMI